MWKTLPNIKLSEIIKAPNIKGQFRAKFVYDNNSYDIEYHPYQPKIIKTFKIIESNEIDYHLKYLDREELDCLSKQKDDCDEIIIISNGLVTDTSIANLYFWDNTEWVTPKDPLLKGTYRSKLICENKVTEREISESELLIFGRIAVSNAMIGFVEVKDYCIKY